VGGGDAQVGGVDPAVDKDRAVDVGVMGGGVDGGLEGGVSTFLDWGLGIGLGRKQTSSGTSWSSMLPINVRRAP
jgi:hypothetical protein